MVEFKDMEVAEIIVRFGQFVRLPAGQKMEYFDFLAPKLCSDEWRENFKQFLSDGSQGRELMDKVFDHIQVTDKVFDHIEIEVFDPAQVTTACISCRSTFWRLVWLSTNY